MNRDFLLLVTVMNRVLLWFTQELSRSAVVHPAPRHVRRRRAPRRRLPRLPRTLQRQRQGEARLQHRWLPGAPIRSESSEPSGGQALRTLKPSVSLLSRLQRGYRITMDSEKRGGKASMIETFIFPPMNVQRLYDYDSDSSPVSESNETIAESLPSGNGAAARVAA